MEECKPILVGKEDENTKLRFSIRPHLPDSHYTIRQRYNEWVKQIIEDNKKRKPEERQTFQFKGDEFFVDGIKIVEKIKVPTFQALLELSQHDREMLDLQHFVSSRIKKEKRSSFQAFAATACSESQVETLYLKMKKDFPTATHICMAYRFDGPNDKPLQGAVSDGEHQSDVKLLDVLHKSRLQNVAVFVVRKYGGFKMGGQRLVNIMKTATQVLTQLHKDRGEEMESSNAEHAE